MHGVSEVIAIILILMITISLAGLAYMFMSTTMADVTASAGSTVDSTTSNMMTTFKIESMSLNKVYLRNTGQNALSSLSVYVNDVPAHINITPGSIAPGQIGTIMIYDFIDMGDRIKITSSNGFSTSKEVTTDPCNSAIACFRFAETGSSILDSSPSRNDGTTYSNRVAADLHTASGKLGSAMRFLTDDEALIPDAEYLKYKGGDYTITAWVNADVGDATDGYVISKPWHGMGYYNYIIAWTSSNKVYVSIAGSNTTAPLTSTGTYSEGMWHYIAVVFNNTGIALYVNGVLDSSRTHSITNFGTSGLGGYPDINRSLTIGNIYPLEPAQSQWMFNGIVDEVRIYNRAIY